MCWNCLIEIQPSEFHLFSVTHPIKLPEKWPFPVIIVILHEWSWCNNKRTQTQKGASQLFNSVDVIFCPLMSLELGLWGEFVMGKIVE